MYARNLSGMGLVGLGPVGEKPIDVRDIYPKGVNVGERQRALDPEKVRELAKSILEHSQKQPIGVRRRFSGGGFDLIYGAHRLEAIKLIEREGWAEEPKVWAIIYEHDYPELLMEMDELIENLHRNELTPAQKAAHQLTYAGLLKKANKVQKADKKRSQTQLPTKSQHDTRDATQLDHVSENGKSPTILEKLTTDSGITKEGIRRRHITGQKLAARLGVEVGSLEEATSDELLEAGKAAAMAAQDKKDKAKESGKPEWKTDPVRPLPPQKYRVTLNTDDLPTDLIKCCRKWLNDPAYPLTLDVLKATHEALGELIKELTV